MSDVLLDTNIVSYLLKEDTRMKVYSHHLENRDAYISFVTLAELYRWPIVRGWSAKRTQRFKAQVAAYPVIAPNIRLCEEWARIVSIKGAPIGYNDAWIAATTIHYDLPLVSHNKKHFRHIAGLNLISENQS